MNELTHTFQVSGMSCPGCANKVSGVLSAQNITCKIDFASGQLRVSPKDAGRTSTLVRSLGYSISDPHTHGQQEHDHSSSTLRLTICIALTAPLFFGHIFNFHWLHNIWLQFALTTPVYLIGAAHFGRSAWIGLKSGVAHMDLLVILGATAAYIYSLVGLVFGLGNNYLFFESAASIITFVLIGGFIEQVAVKRTSSALNALRSLRPSRAKRVTDNGRVEEVAVEDLQVNNIVLLGVGDSVPCDGKVTAGTGDIDESTLTGEPIPATKDLNSKVFAGTTVVSGSLSVRVSSLGSDTVLGRIIDTVSSAQFGKPKIQRVGDKVSSIFVPAVIGIAAFTFLINLYFSIQLSDSLLRAIAVVVIACPCAMGLATPVAIMMCLGELARRGVLIKSGDVIEGLAGVKNAFFDKTGTLTKGVIEASLVTSKISEDKLGSIVLGLEQHSSHPIAKALVQKYCHLIPSRFESVEEKPGQGIFGSISDDFFAITKINNLNGGDIGVFKNNELVAAFALKDELRSEGSEAIAALKSMGISSYILSGDNSVRCKEVGATLTIPSHSGLLPEDKLRKIQELSSNQPSVFVGDGINDVLGLAGAGIGISFSNASDIAVKTAPVVITRADLRIIPEIVRYSKQVLRTIKQNLFWAFFYNVVAIPIAAFGLLTPTIAAIVMGLSDVVVVGNSLRLRRK